MRRIVVASCLAFVIASCGGGELTAAEYAEEIEGLTTTMYQRLDDLSRMAGVPSEIVTVEDTRTYYNELAAAFRELRDGLKGLQPPEESVEGHAVSVDLANSLTMAAESFAQLAEDAETEDELKLLFDSPEAAAVVAARDEMIAFCQTGQAEFDATADREVFDDVPWIPSELQEVVRVFLGC